MANRIVETQFKFVNDKQATNQVLRDNARIDNSLEDIDAAAEKVTDAYTEMEQAAEKAAKANKEAADAGVRAAKEQSELVGDVASRTSQLSGALSGLGAVGGQRLMIAADLFDLVEAGQLLRGELPALGNQLVTNAGGVKNLALQLGLLSAATVGLFLAYKAVTSATAESREEAERFIATQRRLREVVTEGLNFDEIQSKIEDLRTTNNNLATDLDALIKKRDEEVQSLSRVGLVGELIGGPLAQGVGKMNDEINTLTETIDNNLAAIDKLNGALTTEQRINEEILNDLTARFDAEIELARLIREGTSEGIRERIKAIEDEIAINQALVEETRELNRNTGEFSENLEMFRGNLEELSTELNILNGALDAVGTQEAIDNYNAIVAEQEAKVLAANAALFNLNEELEEVGTSFETIEAGAKLFAEAEAERLAIVTETEQAILDVQSAGKDKRAQLEAETQDKLADLAADRVEALGAIEDKHDERVNELKRKAHEEAIRDLQDFQHDQRRAEKDHRDTLLDAAGRLDAVAILDEQRSFTKDQKRAKEDFKLEQKRKKKEFKAELKAEDAAFKKELQQAKRNFRKRETELRDHLNRQLATQRSAQTQEISKLRGHQAQRLAEIDSALQAELGKLTGFTQDEIAIRDDHYVQMLDQLQLFVNDANMIAAGLDGGGGGAVGSPAIPNTFGAVGQFPLSAGLRSPSGIASPFASPMAMMPPVSRSMSTSTRSAQVTNNFSGMDRLTPGQIRNVVKIVNSEMMRALA